MEWQNYRAFGPKLLIVMNSKQISRRTRRIHAVAFALLALITFLFLPAIMAFIGQAPELALATAGLFGMGRILLKSDSAPGLGEAMSEAEFQKEVLGGVNLIASKVKTHSDQIALLRHRLNGGDGHPVSERCGRYLGAVTLVMGLRCEKILSGKAHDFALGYVKDVLGIDIRTALTSSDIPLPVEYQGEVAELVGLFGVARKYATIMPLGAGQVKLPKLKTDTTFGLIGQSVPVPEKSPQTEWVTFNAEKFGGLVRLPNEMDEDSIVGLGQFLARYAARQIAYLEDWQVFRSTGAGSGVNGSAEGLTKSVVTNSKTTTSTGLGSPSEFSVTHLRTLRTVCDSAALRTGCYYAHPSFDALFTTFNTSGNRPYNPNAQIAGTGANPMVVGPTLDGYPIRWVDVMPVFNTVDVLSTVHVLFGDVSYQYLGLRGGLRFDTSKEAAFETDEILVRALERMTTGLMANGAVGGLITAAA